MRAADAGGERLIVDANLLVLYVVGAVDRTHVGRHKRTATFTADDFDLIVELFSKAAAVIVTPNILTEVSNVCVFGLGGRSASAVREKLRLFTRVEGVAESYVPSRVAADRVAFSRLGLTDAGILELSASGHTVLTDDLPLCLELARLGARVLNFNHLRTHGGS